MATDIFFKLSLCIQSPRRLYTMDSKLLLRTFSNNHYKQPHLHATIFETSQLITRIAFFPTIIFIFQRKVCQKCDQQKLGRYYFC